MEAINKKYLLGAIGLGIGILLAYFLTRKSQAAPPEEPPPEEPPPEEPPPEEPPPGTGNVYGVVTNRSTGQPIAGAAVVLIAEDNTSTGAYTDHNGRYTIQNLPLVTVTWRATASGYAEIENSGVMTVQEGNNELNISLMPITQNNNIITFGTLSGSLVPVSSLPPQSSPPVTPNLDCTVTNQGPATIRTIGIHVRLRRWYYYDPVGYRWEDYGIQDTFDIQIPANGTVVIEYRGNEQPAPQLWLGTHSTQDAAEGHYYTYEIYLVDMATGAVSNSINLIA